MKKHIFVIDDDEDDLKTFILALEQVPGSFKCTYANCPAKGLNILQYLQPDYIFLDYNLPVMNGIEVLKEIKKDRRLNDIPAYLCSSLLNNTIRQSALKAGAAECFQKPATVSEMVSLLGKLLAPVEFPTFFLYADPASSK